MTDNECRPRDSRAVWPRTHPVVAAINCNGPAFTGSMAVSFSADHLFIGGSGQTSNVGILGTCDDPVFQTYRWGTFSYAIPVPPGRYFVVLLMAETYGLAVGDRRFGVSTEGTSWLDGLDVLERTGRTTAFSVGREVDVVDGYLDVGFNPGAVGNPMLHGLVVLDLDAAEGVVFVDGFENGSTSRWSQVAP